MSWLKVVFKVVAVLVVAGVGLVAAGIAILASQDLEQLRQVVEQRVSAATGRSLSITGDIHITPAWVPTLGADGVRLANAEWSSEPEMLRAGRLQAEIELLPLLKGEVRLHSFRLSGGAVLLERRADGAANWQFTANNADESLEGAVWLVDLETVEISDFTARYRDALTGHDLDLQLDALRLDVADLGGQVSLNARGALEGVSVTARGTLGPFDALLSGQQPVALDLKGSLGGVDLTAAGAIERPHDLSGLNFKVAAQSERLAGVVALLREKFDTSVPDLGWRSGSASGQLRGSASRLELTDAKLNVETGLVALSAEGAVGDLNSLASVNASFSAHGSALGELLERLGERAPPAVRWLEPLNGAFSVAGQISGAVPHSLEFKQVEASFAGVGDTQVNLASATVALKSPQAGAVDFKARSGAPDVLAAHPLLAPFVGALPVSLTGPLQLQGRFDLKEQGLVSLENLDGRVGEHAFAGAVTIDMNSKPVAARVNFRAPYVALADLGLGSPEADDSVKGPIFSEEPLPVHLLDQVNLAADVEIDVLDGRDWQIQGFATTFHATPGGLDVSRLDGRVAGGRVSFKADVKRDAGSGQVGVHLVGSGRGLDAGTLIRLGRGSTPLTQSPLDFEVNLSGQGGSIDALAGTSNGKFDMVLGPGRLESSLLSVAGGDLVSGLFAALTPFYSGADQGELTCGVALFDVKNGVAAASRGIAFETGRVNIVGSGTVDLGTEQLDLALQPVARQGLGVNLASIADLWQIRGSLSSPEVVVDAGKITRKALSLGAALATGGISLLAEGLLGRVLKDPNPCKSLLEGAS
jgi:uncharacterized protein involved in outer membrane biogenesis